MKNTQTGNDAKKRPTIGLLIDWVGGRYQSHIWQGALAAAEERDANLIIFSGRSLRAPQGYLSQSNVLFDVISSENLDGLVILSGTIFNYVTENEFRAFAQRFQALPLISISIELENIPSVLIDNRAGIRSVVSHLIETHGHRKIAFIGGPEVNEEAQERYAAYQEELARHGIPLDPMLVAPGDFSESAGIKAAATFFDERRVKPDAIVAVDDDTALGLLNALGARGLHVPEDIAVSGFDNITEAKYASPPLTTVIQPFYRQAHLAISMMLDHLNGMPIPPTVHLPTEIVVRESCGCMTEAVHLAGIPAEQAGGGSQNEMLLEPVIAEVRNAIEQNCLIQNDKDHAPDLATQLVSNFVWDVNHSDANKFIMTLSRVLRSAVVQRGEIGKWQTVVSSMRKAVITQWPEQARKGRAEELWGQARVFIGELMESIQGHQLLQFRNHSLIEVEVERSVLATLEFEELKSILTETLPALGVASGYIVLSKAKDYNPASLFLAFNENGVLMDGNPVVYNPLKHIVPEEFLPQSRRYTLVMEALYFQSEQLGFALFEMNPQQDGILYSELRQQISSAVMGASLLFQYKQKEQETQSINRELVNYRENLEKMVAERTEELTFANERLQQEIFERKQVEQAREKLIDELKEKNAELESFTYTVSHDLKSPLVTINGFLGYLEQDAAAGNMERLKKDTQRIYDAVKKMQSLLNELLELSRIGRMVNISETMSFDELVKDTLGIVQGRIEEKNIQVQVQSNLPTIQGDRQRLTEVLQNLIDNAAKYMGDQPNPLIEIGQHGEKDSKPLLFVRDNGIGIAPEYHERIFGLFNKLDARSDGTGIGLALVKRIIEFHGGKIWVESDLPSKGGAGKGSTFYFTLPKI